MLARLGDGPDLSAHVFVRNRRERRPTAELPAVARRVLSNVAELKPTSSSNETVGIPETDASVRRAVIG